MSGGRWRHPLLALLALGAALVGAPAHAHLIAANKGTLNLVGDGAFLVLSVPVSALQGVDDDADGALTPAELRAHDATARAQVQAGVQLLGASGPLPLQVVALDAAPPENTPAAPSRHLTLLGRFQLAPEDLPTGPLALRLNLFGAEAPAEPLHMTITRQQPGQARETQWLRLSPGHAAQAVLPGVAQVFAHDLASGSEHVLAGPDHLLFLLVVLAAGWGWRALLGALTCFTAGHALTLAVCVWVGWQPPASWVEPAIAATITGLAAFDGWAQRRAKPLPAAWRLALVFCCAAIHGLGLAGALADLTQWPTGSPAFLWALAGFNLGIELAQVGVALLAGAARWTLRRVLAAQAPSVGAGGVPQGAKPWPSAARGAVPAWVHTAATWAAMAAGALWFVQRVAAGG